MIKLETYQHVVELAAHSVSASTFTLGSKTVTDVKPMCLFVGIELTHRDA